ncbi:hypothetical protein BBF96_12080 [Anoxybacter fermentans]|uniref:Uncharacterized protein n=1 Tax=Anoxybacter fermentans TaxID=1323375 RepID=A0A3S9T0K2_9FIRM|nr:hypothetical protein [Anoxybacter fermentans]AZR74069.1 hypothetical protein BBF96_12080 [Anoxybacter fermentans]
MNILENILRRGLKTIAIVGMAKNVGKTVTLTHLIQRAEREGIRLGLTSIGRDGERLDALSAADKPQIQVTVGTLFATAQRALEKTNLRAQVLADTGIKTVLGGVYIYEAMEDGFVELVGPRSHSQIKKVIELMFKEVDLILVDGAINRSSSAAPSITDGVILATGAVIGPDIRTVVEKTVYQVGCFCLPAVEDERMAKICWDVIEKYNGGVISNNYEVKPIEMVTALMGIEKIVDAINEDTQALVLGGALTEGFLTSLEKEVGEVYNLKIIVRDGTRIFLKPRTFNRFLSRGGIVQVLKPIQLVAVTVNSTTPQGGQLDPDELCTSLARQLKNIPILDLVLGKSILIGRPD